MSSLPQTEGVERMTEPVYRTAAWKRIRLVVLERDGGVCQIRLRGCKGNASAVDHIVPVSAGGDWYALENLRASCANCNSRRVNRSAKPSDNAWRTARTRIVLVVGPPCPGLLLDYCEEHRHASDLVVDYRLIAAGLGGDHKATMTARNALLRALRRGEINAARAWVTSSNTDAEGILCHHEVRSVDPGRDEALRLVADRPELLDPVESWYRVKPGRPMAGSRLGPSREW
jgi:hypothetical protein